MHECSNANMHRKMRLQNFGDPDRRCPSEQFDVYEYGLLEMGWRREAPPDPYTILKELGHGMTATAAASVQIAESSCLETPSNAIQTNTH